VNLADPRQSHYKLLQISPSSSLSSADIKAAYHKALLKFHPDKAVLSSLKPTHHNRQCESLDESAQGKHKTDLDIDIAQLKEAYITLSSPHLRVEYDFKLAGERFNNGDAARGPRPAQIISLEEFDDRLDGFWHHVCRCGGGGGGGGGGYVISETEMERGCHLVACNSCSEVVWVGYEIVEDLETNQNETAT